MCNKRSIPIHPVEPHAYLLRAPGEEQLLYKIMSVENLLRSISNGYLHFNRVDRYSDFREADEHDSEQVPKDVNGNRSSRFRNAQSVSAANYYNNARARTYACCFSLENSDYIWNKYADDNEKGKVCVVFKFGPLRSYLNHMFDTDRLVLEYGGEKCRQIFWINYGIIDYVKWDEVQCNTDYLPNPVKYTYIKDICYAKEKELRISLSTVGVGEFVLANGNMIKFPESLHCDFDFRWATEHDAIQEILYAPDCDKEYLRNELFKLHVTVKDGSA